MSDDFDYRTAGFEPDGGLDFIGEVWARRKHLAFAVFISVLVAAVVVAASVPDIYRASAKVIVDRQEVSENFVEPSVTADLETRIQTIDQRVRARESLSKVITDKNLYPALRRVVPMDVLVDRMRQDLTLKLEGIGEQQNGKPTTVGFTVTYRGRDPQTVADVANTIAALYVEENTKSRKRQAVVTANVLEQEVERAKREMDALDRRASEFTRQNTEALPQQLEVNMAALERLSTELRQNGEYQLRAIERRERLEKELADSASTGAGTSEEAMSARLEKLRGDLAELKRNYSDKHPDVIRVTGEIAALEARMGSADTKSTVASENASRSSLSRALTEVNDQIKSLKEEEARLRQASASYETRVEGAPRRRTEIERLSRGNDSSRERYDALLKRYQAAKLATTLEDSEDLEQFRILDAAVPPLGPAMPNRMFIVGMGLLAALGAVGAAVLGAEKLDTTFHSPSDLRSLISVPILATVATVPTRRAAARRMRRVTLTAGAAIVLLTLIVLGSYHVARGNESLVRMVSRGGE